MKMKEANFQFCWMYSANFIFSVLIFSLCLGVAAQSFGQEKISIINESSFDSFERMPLGDDQPWKFKLGTHPNWAEPDLDTQDWKDLAPGQLTKDHKDQNGRIEGWFRIKVRQESEVDENLGIFIEVLGQVLNVYVDGELVQKIVGIESGNIKSQEGVHNIFSGYQFEIPLHFEEKSQVKTIAVHYIHEPLKFPFSLFEKRRPLMFTAEIGSKNSIALVARDREFSRQFQIVLATSTFILTVLFWLLYGLNKEEENLKYIAWVASLYFLVQIPNILIQYLKTMDVWTLYVFDLLEKLFIASILLGTVFLIAKILSGEFPKHKWLFFLAGCLAFLDFSFFRFTPLIISLIVFFIFSILYFTWKSRNTIHGAHWAIVGGTLIFLGYGLFIFFLSILSIIQVSGFPATLAFLIFPFALLVYVAVRFKEILMETRQKAEEVVKITKEKAIQTEKQNVILESKVKERTMDLQKSLENLKATQSQLIQQEKLASLGQLTAGIAHEIKNPLNFVNNFSDVSIEMIDEAIDEVKAQGLAPQSQEDIIEILSDIKSNLTKIHEHGSRADGIVKSMLMHSRGGSGKMEPTDLNALVREYVNLSFHGMRAGKDPINVDIQLDLDESIDKVDLVGEDFSRVILNLCSNAFDAMRTVKTQGLASLNVRTKKHKNTITIEIEDNGPGIPDDIKEKILQPFFTTKKGTEGTGLGLSITHDIVKAHGGELKVESPPSSNTSQSKRNTGSLFSIKLPAKSKAK
jgi:two-component system, NtrC family, sensor kinase